MKKRSKVKILKGERTLMISIVLLIILNVFGSSFSMALVSKTNIELVQPLIEAVAKPSL